MDDLIVAIKTSKIESISSDKINEIYRKNEHPQFPGWSDVQKIYSSLFEAIHPRFHLSEYENPLSYGQSYASWRGKKCVACGKFSKTTYVRSPRQTDHILTSTMHLSIICTPICIKCLAKKHRKYED